MKTQGFNIQDLDKDNSDIGNILNIGGEGMQNELNLKKSKKKKWNFDNILPKTNEKNMGLDETPKQKNMGMNIKIKSLSEWDW